MDLPFSTQQFLEVFRLYNQSIFPVQIVFYLLGIACLYLLVAGKRYSGRVISSILGFFWMWMGIVYHIMNFSVINKAAYVFGALFVLQSLFIIYFGLIKDELQFGPGRGMRDITGMIFIAYAMVGYSLIGYAAGHAYPIAPVFGVAPCPTTIFTLGLLMLAKGRLNIIIVIIPFLWSIIGFTAALKLGITEDTGLLVSGLVTASVVLFSNRRRKLATN